MEHRAARRERESSRGGDFKGFSARFEVCLSKSKMIQSPGLTAIPCPCTPPPTPVHPCFHVGPQGTQILRSKQKIKQTLNFEFKQKMNPFDTHTPSKQAMDHWYTLSLTHSLSQVHKCNGICPYLLTHTHTFTNNRKHTNTDTVKHKHTHTN